MNIICTEIIPIISYTWAKSFINIDTNKKVIRDRGWDPLDKILVQHPEIVFLKPSPDLQKKIR